MFLKGTRVLDFTRLLPGPYATLRLAELGAEIIKVESVEGGDPARAAGHQIDGSGVVYLANNRNKQSVVLDLKSRAGQASAMELAAQVDVVMEGFRPDVAQRLGVGYEAIRAVNPRVVYCALTGYGQTGPLRDSAGHDLNYLAASGVLAQLKDPMGKPIVPSLPLADHIGGIVAVEAILAALVHRHTTGEGAYLDVSLTDALLGLLTTHALIHSEYNGEFGMEVLAGTVVCYNLYDTQDGRTVSLCALEPKFWRNFCDAVEKPRWYGEAFAPADGDSETYQDVQALFRRYPSSYWRRLGTQWDICLQPVLSVSEALTSDHAKERQVVRTLTGMEHHTMHYVDTHVGGHGVLRPVGTWPPKLGKENDLSE